MKYMLMMNTPGNGPYQIANWPQKDIQAHIAFMMDFSRKLERDHPPAGRRCLNPLRVTIVRSRTPCSTGSAA